MDEERRKKIFAPVMKVGGVVKPLKNKTPSKSGYTSAIEALKGDLTPTILKTFTFRDGNNIYNYDKCTIQSVNRGKKHVCFLVTGEPKIMTQDEAIESMPDYISDTIKNMNDEVKSDVGENIENVD